MDAGTILSSGDDQGNLSSLPNAFVLAGVHPHVSDGRVDRRVAGEPLNNHKARALYLCTETGFPLSQVEMRFHVGPFDFSAYLKSPFITKLHKNAELDFAEMNPLLLTSTEEARQKIKSYFRSRAAERARYVVEDWKTEQVYPYQGEATSTIEVAERQVFDIVAVTASEYLADFEKAPKKSKAFSLRMLRTAIERSPEDLQLILTEVLNLCAPRS